MRVDPAFERWVKAKQVELENITGKRVSSAEITRLLGPGRIVIVPQKGRKKRVIFDDFHL